MAAASRPSRSCSTPASGSPSWPPQLAAAGPPRPGAGARAPGARRHLPQVVPRPARRAGRRPPPRPPRTATPRPRRPRSWPRWPGRGACGCTTCLQLDALRVVERDGAGQHDEADDGSSPAAACRAAGFHGVLAAEKATGQDVHRRRAAATSTSPAGRHRRPRHTVSYAEVAADVVALVEGGRSTSSRPSPPGSPTRAGPAAGRGRRGHRPQARRRRSAYPFGDVAVTIAASAGAGRRRARRQPRRRRRPPSTPRSAARRPARGTVADVSPLVETDPVGGPDQPAYLNAVLLARTRPGAVDAAARAARHRGGARPDPRDPLGRRGPRPRPHPVRRARHARASAMSADPDLLLPHPRAADARSSSSRGTWSSPRRVLRVDGDVRRRGRPARAARP